MNGLFIVDLVQRTLIAKHYATEFLGFFVSECGHFGKSAFAHTPARLTAAATAVVVAERSHSKSDWSRQLALIMLNTEPSHWPDYDPSRLVSIADAKA
jgi:hypothetical protein